MTTTAVDFTALPAVSLAELVSIRRRFLRSINIERDFYSDDPLDGYVLTSSAVSALERLAEGITHTHARAFSITGPYGTGKSAFALFAAKVLSAPAFGSPQVRENLSQQEPSVAERFNSHKGGFWPVLVTGSRESIGIAIIRGVRFSLQNSGGSVGKSILKALMKKCVSALASSNPTANDVVTVVRTASALCVEKSKGTRGLLLVLDEVGKFLEYAAIHPHLADIQILQELAEYAVRESESPLFLVTILHQAFDEYAHRLSVLQRTEWNKVQGRFSDIPFGDTPEETLRLIANAIEPVCGNAWFAEYTDGVAVEHLAISRELGIFPSTHSAAEYRHILSRTFPIHPLALRVIPHLFRRFGQNERSLFSFLSSEEPFSFHDFLRGHTMSPNAITAAPMLEVHHLYDYIVSSLGSSLYTHPTAKQWGEAEEALFRLRDSDPLQSKLVKTIGVLHILGEQTRVLPSKEMLCFALSSEGEDSRSVEAAISSLESATLITFRQFRKAYRLYEGSDIDVEARLREARAHFTHGTDGVKVARDLQVTPPIVARRHSYETGTLRFFDVRYCRFLGLDSEVAAGHPTADGLLLLCLAADETEKEFAEQRARELTQNRPNIIIGISVETEALHESAVATECLKWVLDETPELRTDRVAKREVNERLHDATCAFQAEWERLLRPSTVVGEGGSWFYQGEQETLVSYRNLQALVSKACGITYHAAPKLKNELVNRRQLSSAAASARRTLIDRMINHRTEKRLGIEDFPAEAGIYASLLQSTSIHVEANGQWVLQRPPTSDQGLLRVWATIEQFLFDGDLRAKPLPSLLSILRAAPFGLTDGVIPILLAAVILYHETEVAIYEDDIFTTEVDSATFERLGKRPEHFKLRGCRVAGERQVVVSRFAAGLLHPDEQRTIVNVVRELYRSYKKLPEYTLRTKRLSQKAGGLRDVFKAGKDPDYLLFSEIPELLGVDPFEETDAEADKLGEFFANWNVTMSEVKGAYASLLQRIENTVVEAFDVKDWVELRSRSVQILPHVSERNLKTFLLRTSDESLAHDIWLESVASGLMGRPPAAWSDAEEERFLDILAPLVSAFHNAELLAFERRQTQTSADHTGMRLVVTSDSGAEDAQVVFTAKEDDGRIDELAAELLSAFNDLLAAQPRDVRLGVIGRVTREMMRERQ